MGRGIRRVLGFSLRYLYAALCSIYLVSFGFVFSRNRKLISTLCAHFGGVRVPHAVVPTLKLSTVVPDDVPVQIREPIAVDGNVSVLELVVISKLVRILNPKGLFEIGTFDGRTTLNLAANCSGEARVYTLDFPRDVLISPKLPLAPGDENYIRKEGPGCRFRGTDCQTKIVQLWGDSATFEFSSFCNKIDFVFVDGSHSYEYVLNDSKRALGLLRNGRGVVLWHDYTSWEGVTKALNGLFLNAGEFKNLRHIEGTSLVYLPVNQNAGG